jgi:hypothetical protein
MIVRIKTAKGGLQVSAGVHAASKHPPYLEEVLTGSLSSEQFHRYASVASTAVADRLGGIDLANAEHELQERLAVMHARLGLAATLREFPAVRPVDNRGFIDLLAAGRDGALHVVETKIGPDPMLVLQGLDYWCWATAHASALAHHVNEATGAALSASPRVSLDFVVAEKSGEIVSPYTASQLEALDGSIAWQVHRFDDWSTESAALSSFGRRRVPGGSRATDATFAVRLESELTQRLGDALHRRAFFHSGHGVAAVAQPTLEALRERELLHGFVDHVRSSQAFALNLFAGLTPAAVQRVWQLIDPAVIEPVGIEFEYLDPQDDLGELQAARPHQTQVDVLLRGQASDGTMHVALVEVKLSETAFGSCGGFDAAGQDAREICRNPGAWGGDPSTCVQLRNYNGPTRRRYDHYISPEMVRTTTLSGCPFHALNQPMRNVALARALVQRGEADAASFVLCAPWGNKNVWRQWRAAKDVFTDVPGIVLKDLTFESMLEAVEPDRRAYLEHRYCVGLGGS